MTDMAGGKEKSERQPLRDCMVNPLPHLSTPPPSLPVCFAMVTRQGSQCSQLMCFSVAGTSGVLMRLGLSPTQSMSTVLGCTNTRRAEDNKTVGQPQCGKTSLPPYLKTCPLPQGYLQPDIRERAEAVSCCIDQKWAFFFLFNWVRCLICFIWYKTSTGFPTLPFYCRLYNRLQQKGVGTLIHKKN